MSGTTTDDGQRRRGDVHRPGRYAPAARSRSNVTSGTLTGTSTGTVPVTPAPAAKLVIQTQPSQTATAGFAFATQPVIYEEDQFGNLLTGDNSTVGDRLSRTAAPARCRARSAATVSGGVATFTGLADDAAGTITLQFTGAGLTSIPSVPIVISPAAASKLVIQTQPSAAATAGQAFATQPVIDEEDQFGNVETGDNSTIVTASLASGAGPLHGTHDRQRLRRRRHVHQPHRRHGRDHHAQVRRAAA